MAGDQSFGSFYESYPLQFGSGLQIGSTGSTVVKAIAGNCNASVASLPAAATSTFAATCAVANAAVGDKVNTASPVAYSVHTDHLMRPIAMTDATEAMMWSAVYKPFGEVFLITGALADLGGKATPNAPGGGGERRRSAAHV